jgi:hypothetical protein
MQSTSSILMIRPVCFFYNEETGKSNSFQNKIELDSFSLTESAQEEFDGFVEVLRGKGVQVFVIEDTLIPAKPDALFPNNWISFHEGEKLVTYPMQSRNRRSERRLEIIQNFSFEFEIKEFIDLSTFEEQSKFLEGTGSMVLDRNHKIAYACLSPRTNVVVLEQFAQKMSYKTISFKAVDQMGKPIYHTNVMMCVGEKFVVVCMEAIKELEDRKALINSFSETKKELITISYAQMNAFAGNMLQIKTKEGTSLIVLSNTAYMALGKKQMKSLSKFGELLPVSIPTIEEVGGGSVRCMMAEVFLNPKNL